MEIGAAGIRKSKKERVVTIKVTTEDIETRIKSDHAPFSRNNSMTSSSNNSNPNNASSILTHSSTGSGNADRSTFNRVLGSGTPSRYPTKTPYQEALNLTGRAGEVWEKIIADGPRHKAKKISSRVKSEEKEQTRVKTSTATPREVRKGSKPMSRSKNLAQSSHISYNRTIIDFVEKDRYSHPNYNVDHLVPRKIDAKKKIDARYGE